ncbi:LacI family DNA-binding transcriptional regulator [Brucella pseudogrignonensis]|uniref:LacI family DNA-binding transcriptional regulator n=1 Tax=Brucella pseudogrignonensis TaxID=419475 RepID=UPI000DE38F88|nr:LacI family DNA-binding transcriptional regulator [Brucella pseudogrignonensis]MCD4513697.1 LacI family DNA-binding transcriptional regulator [Brucella pseudogrignonensis]
MKRDKPYASSTDVARLAGVSQSAVSRTFKPGASVSPETRKKVLAAAEELGYRPSFIPSIMLSHRSRLVAVVIGGLYNPFYTSVLETFSKMLQAEGWRILLVHVESGHTFDDIVPMLAGYRVDAIVSALAVLSPEALEQLSQLRVPVISFNTRFSGEWVHSISCDSVGASRVMAEHFIERGARKFAYITGPADSQANIDRQFGFCKRLEETGFEPPLILEGNYRYEAGYAAIKQLKDMMSSTKELPDAIYCANDLLALGAIDALRKEIGVRIPDDIIVGGYDNIAEAGWASYNLTTLVHDGEKMVERAIEILAESEPGQIGERDHQSVIASPLIIRNSTGGSQPAGEAKL